MEDAGVILAQLQSGQLHTKLTEAFRHPLKAMQVPQLLVNVGVEPRLMQKLFRFFDRTDFAGDPEDRIDLNNITLSQLIRRLTNACMYEMWEVRQETDLADYLRKHRGQPFKPTLGALTDRSKVTTNFDELQLEEMLHQAEANKAQITAALEGGYAAALKALASLLGCEVDEATVTDFVASTSYTGETKSLAGTRRTPGISKQTHNGDGSLKQANYEGFIRHLTDWIQSQPPRLKTSHFATPQPSSRGAVEVKIEETLKTYEALREMQLANDQDTSAVDSIIKACQMQLLRPSKDNFQSQRRQNDKWLAKCRQGLSDIFQFYAKQVRMIGKAPSFAEIEKANQVWNLSKFLKFLKDFGLSELPVGSRSLTRVEGSDIFMKFAHLRRALSEDAFMLALESVAEAFYNEEFDDRSGTQLASLEPQEKLVRLYEQLGCDNVGKYSKRMKGFGLAFSSDTHNRIPPNDPAKRYRFRASQKVLEDLDDWKKRNPRRGNLSSNAPKMSRPVQDMPERKVLRKKLDISAMQTKSAITWKKLGEMSFDQLKDPEDQFDIRNLIVDSDSDDGLSYKLPVLKEKPKPPEPSAKPRSMERPLAMENSYYTKMKHKLKT